MNSIERRAIAEITGMVHEHLRWFRVAPEELEDLTQEVLVNAWATLQEGGFQVHPNAPMAQSLEAWLYGITWRILSHHRGKAYRRREVAVRRPEAYRHPRGGVEEPLPVLEARSALRCVARMIAAGELDVELLFTDPTDPKPANLVAIAMRRQLTPRALSARRDTERQVLRGCLDHEPGSISCTKMEATSNPLEWNLHASEPCESRGPVVLDFSASGVSCSPARPASPSADGSCASG